MQNLKLTTLSLAITLGLSACGGDGGSTSGNTGATGTNNAAGSANTATSNPATPAVETYLFAQPTSGTPARAGIVLVDPANPSAATQVVPSGTIDETKTITTGNWNGANNSSTNQHRSHLLYRSGGTLYLLDLRKGNGVPMPVQVSNETSACAIDQLGLNYSTPSSSRAVYRTPGNNGSCNDFDDVLKQVRLDMNATDTPLTLDVFQVLREDFDLDGDHNGWIAVDADGNLNRYHVSFANPAKLAEVTSAAEVRESSAGGFLIHLNDQLRQYNRTTASLDPAIYTLSGLQSFDNWRSQHGFTYLIVNSGAGTRSLWRARSDGSGAAQQLADNIGHVGQMEFTTNKVVLRAGSSLKAIAKDGTGGLVSLVAGGVTGMFYTAGDKVFFQSTLIGEFKIVSEEGNSISSFVDTWLLTTTTPTSLDLNDVRFDDKLLLVDEDASGDLGGSIVKTLDPITMTQTVVGVAPPDALSFESAGAALQPGDKTLGFVITATGRDLYFFDASVQGSLQQVVMP